MVVSVGWFQTFTWERNHHFHPLNNGCLGFHVPDLQKFRQIHRTCALPVRGDEPDTQHWDWFPLKGQGAYWAEHQLCCLERIISKDLCGYVFLKASWLKKTYQTNTSFVPWTSQKGSFNLHVSCALGSIPFRRLCIRGGFFSQIPRDSGIRQSVLWAPPDCRSLSRKISPEISDYELPKRPSGGRGVKFQVCRLVCFWWVFWGERISDRRIQAPLHPLRLSCAMSCQNIFLKIQVVIIREHSVGRTMSGRHWLVASSVPAWNSV